MALLQVCDVTKHGRHLGFCTLVLLVLVQKVEITQKRLVHLLLMTSFLVTIVTDHHKTYAKDKRTAIVNFMCWWFIVEEKKQKNLREGCSHTPTPLYVRGLIASKKTPNRTCCSPRFHYHFPILEWILWPLICNYKSRDKNLSFKKGIILLRPLSFISSPIFMIIDRSKPFKISILSKYAYLIR